MSNIRITKKKHTRFMADFLIECTQDSVWKAKLAQLEGEQKLDTVVEGMPAMFSRDFPEAAEMNLQYCIEPIDYDDVPRKASRWWPKEENARYFMCYPARFPESALYLAFDLDTE